MSIEEVLSDLLSTWQRAQAEGRDVPTNELCRNHPELRPELHCRIELLRQRNHPLQDTDYPTLSGLDEQVQCPDQTLDAGVVGDPLPVASAAQPAGYAVLAELGRGGMGVVYKALQIKANRVVALKMLRAGGLAGTEELARFRTEAEAVARLQHPNIVQVFEVGEHEGLPYFSLEFCPGGSLDRRLQGTPLPAGEAAALVRKLAVAIQAAHHKGVLHRDLKPANVLLAEDGTPKIADFGLAKKLDEAGQTNTGSIIGTPSYMAPEQAQGKKAGQAADVYALGAILYECLTGRPPFKAASTYDTILQVMHAEPAPPRQLNPRVPVDLETICLKCLRKEAGNRYETAQQLAEELTRFLEGRPILARPVGRLERAWRWGRRNPAVALSLAAVTLSLLASSVVSMLFGLRAEQARQDEAARAQGEAIAKQEAQLARHDAHRQLIELSGASGLTAARDGDHSLALLWFARAVQLARDEPELEELNRVRLTNWLREACLPQGAVALPAFQQHQDRFRTFQFSPDGNYLLALASAKDCLVWDCRQSRPVPLPDPATKGSAAAWEPAAGLLAVAGENGQIQLLVPPTFQPREEVPASGAVAVLAFSKDGQRLAWGGSEGVRVWDRRKKEPIGPLLAHPSPVRTLAFSASGQLLATSADDRKARVFRIGAADDQPLFPPVPHVRPEHGLAHGGPDRVAPRFAADDQILLTVDNVGQDTYGLAWRSAVTGQLLPSSSAPSGSKEPTAFWTGTTRQRAMRSNPPPGQAFLTAFTVSPRGDQVAVMWEDNGQLWDARTRQLLGTISMGAYNWCEDVVFAADGKSLVTCGHDMRAQFWSVANSPGGPLTTAAPPIVHPMKVVRGSFSPDGKHLAAALWDGTVYLWRKPAGLPLSSFVPAGGTTLPVVSPNGRFVLPGGTTYRNGTQLTTRVYQAETAEPAGPVLVPGGILLNAVFSPDGTRVATASSTARTTAERNGRLFEPDGKAGNVQIWDWKTGQRLAGPIATPTEPRGLAFHPDGRSLAAVCADYRVVLIEPETGTITRRLDPGVHTRPLNANLWWGNGEARFSPDGRFLVTWEMAPPVHVWDIDTGQLRQRLSHDERVECVAFSPTNPELLATVGRDSMARVWNLATGERLAKLPHPSQISRVRFSPDGRELITGCGDTLRTWDWRAGKLRDALALHPSMDFGFTGDRRWLITLGIEDLQLTDWRTKTPASPLWPLGKNIHLALAIPDGERRLIVGGFSRALEGYDLKAMTTPVDGTPEDLIQLAELAAGRRILSQGSVVPLSSAEWAERWQRHQSAGLALLKPR